VAKRLFDVAVAALALLLLSPLLLLVALAVKLDTPGPVFYRQERVGRHGVPFRIHKFRTMHHGAGGPPLTVGDDARITRSGAWLRRTRIDELPQFIDVLLGRMSLVGPRPEVPRYVEAEDPTWRRVLEERPGITHPVTLRLTDEEGLIAAAGGDPERFYVEELLPWKLAGYLEYAAARSWRSALAVLAATAGELVGRRCYARVELDEVRAAGGGERHG